MQQIHSKTDLLTTLETARNASSSLKSAVLVFLLNMSIEELINNINSEASGGSLTTDNV
jgi:hypothetical protein